MRKIILNCRFALGDVVLLSAAIRDLHLTYPGKFLTDVRTYHREIWRHSPYVVRLDPEAADVELLDCEYPLINRSNQTPHHCIHGFRHFLNEHLGLDITPRKFGGDIHLSEAELQRPSQIEELCAEDIPFWIVDAGGKYDLTIKWWSTERFQEVVDHFHGKIQFVQVGAKWDWHPRLDRVIDLRGRTNVRELIRLVYHSQGMLCGVTGAMHLAAAVGTRPGRPDHRPCVVIAGAREPAHWEAYPQHQFIHTLGSLECCASGGCWKSRTKPLGDGHSRDDPDKLCVDVAGDLPRCMDMISAAEVCHRIGSYFEGSANCFLPGAAAAAAEVGVAATAGNPIDDLPLHRPNALSQIERILKQLPAGGWGEGGEGIVIGAGGQRYLINAWVNIKMLRDLGCTLPIELWCLETDDVDAITRSILATLDVRVIEASEMRKKHPVRRLDVATLRPYAIVHSKFEQVLWLDADNVAASDPSLLFSSDEFLQAGAVLWERDPELMISEAGRRIFGMRQIDGREIDPGQILVDKRRCWKALNLAVWLHTNLDFFSTYATPAALLQIAFWKSEDSYCSPPRTTEALEGTDCHLDFSGAIIFQHRYGRKWESFRPDSAVAGFLGEARCLEFSTQLKQAWEGAIEKNGPRAPQREVRQIWHVHPDLELRDTESLGRIEIAEASWREQYRRGDWQAMPLGAIDLPRVFHDDRQRRFYLLDVVSEVVGLAGEDDIIVLSDGKCCAAPSLTARLVECFKHSEACYSYIRNCPPFRSPLGEDDINAGKVYPECGLFACTVRWWNEWSERLPDLLLGVAQWDHFFKLVVQQTVPGVDNRFDNLVYTPISPTTVELEEFERLLPSRLYNRQRIASESFAPASPIEPDPRPVPPVTICVLTFGAYPELARRCIESIRRHTRRDLYDIVVGANEVCGETLDYLRELWKLGEIDRLVVSESNINKCPMMRKMFEEIRTQFIWWFDDDAFLTDRCALQDYLKTSGDAPAEAVMWGKQSWMDLVTRSKQFKLFDPIEFISEAEWFGGLDTPGGDTEYGREKGDQWDFLAGESWWIRTATIRALDWPDPRLVKGFDDVYICEAIRQQGWRIVDSSPPGVAFIGADRRGAAGYQLREQKTLGPRRS